MKGVFEKGLELMEYYRMNSRESVETEEDENPGGTFSVLNKGDN